MQFNLITAANQTYFPFLEICINSARANCPDLNKIYVIDSGLGETKNLVSLPVEFIDTGKHDQFNGVHSPGWRLATRTKTLGVLSILENYNDSCPLILIDSDTCIVKDISQCLNLDYVLQATTMSDGGHRRSDGIFIKEIASFVCFNEIKQCRNFVKTWSETISYLENNNIDPPHETPSFNFTLRDFEKHISIGSLEENIVCADLKHFEYTLSVHFKSNGGNSLTAIDNFKTRVGGVVSYIDKDYDYLKHLDTEKYNYWKNLYKE